ncbi:MAG: hypothetical protein KDD45_07320, partial [Bdellovibrionales bacterium]|nr:hypothetical protein [Bdellovibrionales bacterium]
VYLIFTFAGYMIGNDTDLYLYFMLAVDCLLMLDAILTIVVFRFWGYYSFTNYEWHKLANLFLNIYLFVSPFMYPFIYLAPSQSYNF